MAKPDYLPERMDWGKAICPSCGEEYIYLLDHKSKTCGAFECLYAYAVKIIKKNEAYND